MPPKKAIVPRRPSLQLLMPDPVNAWTRHVAVRRDRQESGRSIGQFAGVEVSKLVSHKG
jgi:hypothetical protein